MTTQYQPGDKVWYRYQIGGEREQVAFTTPAIVLHCRASSARFVVYNRKTRRVITQGTRISNLKARTVSHALDVRFAEYIAAAREAGK